MILISHRGNINGKIIDRENTINYIEEALNKGYNVEVDIWYNEKSLYLGHDDGKEKVSIEFLKNEKIWAHAKNYDALRILLDNGVHTFFHNEDNYTLTSKGHIWAYPVKNYPNEVIAVLPEWNNELKDFPKNCVGVCSDYIGYYNE